MATGLYNWSRTPSANGTATYNFSEGMAPSAVNDGVRGLMSDVAQYRDDIAGAIVTGGTSTAYTVTSYSNYDTLTHLNGQSIAFTPHATSGATVTLNVDGLGAKPLRSSPGVELPAGVLVQGTPYEALYNSSDSAFYLRSFYANPYSVPLGSGIHWFADSAPNSSFVLPYGQALSRTTYSALFTLWGTKYGTGDGSTTFNVIDMSGYVPVIRDNLSGSAAGRVTTAGSGIDGTTLGASGGAQNVTVALTNLPSTNLSLASLTIVRSGSVDIKLGGSNAPNNMLNAAAVGSGANVTGGGGAYNIANLSISDTQSWAPGGTLPLGGSGTALNNMPPAKVVSMAIRVL